MAESIAQDKELTKKLLHASGVAVPYGRPVEDEDDAWVAAQEVGLPVVVKPQDGNQGKGISVNLTSEEQVRKAYRVAIEFRDDIMVEKYLPGHDWRLLVIGNKLIAAARRDPPLVIGDGTHTVRELVDIVNSDPRRSDGHATSLTKIRFDEIALARLAEQGYTADSVPPRGVRAPPDWPAWPRAGRSRNGPARRWRPHWTTWRRIWPPNATWPARSAPRWLPPV